jgi:large subunit ribosomal protein L4
VTAIDIVDPAGTKQGSRELPADIFAAPVSVPLMHQVIVAGLAGLRAGTHATKTRGDVSGGGRKPWRQKGTGRARQGSIRSPQWTGGGVAHGPQPRDHSMRVNKKMKRGALRSALTDAAASGKLTVISDLSFDEPKTKRAAEILGSLELQGKVLIVLPAPTDDGAVEKSFRNIARVRITYAGGLGTYDVLRADRIVFTTDALDALERGRSSDGSEAS